MEGREGQFNPEAEKAAEASELRKQLIKTLGLENLGPEEIDNILKQLRITVINQEYGHDVNQGNGGLNESGDFVKKYKPEFATLQMGENQDFSKEMVKIGGTDVFAIVQEGKDILCYPTDPFERTRIMSSYRHAFKLVAPTGQEDMFKELDSRFLARLKVARIEPARLESTGNGRWTVKEKGKIFYE